MRRMIAVMMLVWSLPRAAADEIQPADTVGPNVFRFSASEVLVAKDAAVATVSVEFFPGDRGWSGSVGFRTRDGTAQADVDYTPVDGRLDFSGPSGPMPIHIPIQSDPTVPDEKTVLVELIEDVRTVVEGANPAVVRLVENTNGRISFAATQQRVSSARTSAEVRVIRTGTPNGAITVHYATGGQGSVAIAGKDYEAASGSLTFGPGEVERSFTVSLLENERTDATLLKLRLFQEFGPDFHLDAKVMELIIVPTPRLRIQRTSGDRVEIAWPHHDLPWILERSPDLTFVEVEVIPHTIHSRECIALDTPGADLGFYRLSPQ